MTVKQMNKLNAAYELLSLDDARYIEPARKLIHEVLKEILAQEVV